MERTILKDLTNWKNSTGRKPLILKGARQVGKTHILNEFGRQCFENHGSAFHYIDLKEQKALHSIFKDTTNSQEVLRAIQLQTGKKIDTSKDLLILDEIQDCAGAISSLKYFEQSQKELAVVAAGSHMGLIANEESFPVGKVNFLYMFPMNFGEFLTAYQPELAHEFDAIDINSPHSRLSAFIHNKLLEAMRCYFFTGGLPEVVQEFVKSQPCQEIEAIHNVRRVQNELIEGYQADFSKYSGIVNANHIHHVFHSIPAQLSRSHDTEVRRFKFSGVIPKQKGFDRIAGPLHWLIQSRLCVQTFIANKSEQPLMGYCQTNKFKVYFFDIGLLNCLLKTPASNILNDSLGSYKGFIAENFAAQELYAKTNTCLFAWQEGTAEVEFLITNSQGISPLEVKSSGKSRRARSLDSYIQRYHPVLAYKASGENLRHQKNNHLTVIPLYFCSKVI